MKHYRRILALASRYRGAALANVAFNAAYAVFSLFSLLMVIPFLQVLFGTVPVPEAEPAFAWTREGLVASFNYRFGHYVAQAGPTAGLILVCGVVIAVFLLKNASRYAAMYALAPLRNGVTRDLRREVFARVLDLPLGWFSDRRKGDVIARMTGDVTEVEWSIMNTLEAAFREPILIGSFLAAMLLISPQLTLFVFLLLPLTGLVIGGIGKSLRKPSRAAQERLGELISLIEETLGGLRIVKGFGAEAQQRHRFEGTVQGLYREQTRALRRKDMASPASEFLGIVVVAVVLWFGGGLVLDGAFAPEVFIGYIVIFANLLNPAKAFAGAFASIQRGIASMERIELLLAAEGESGDALSRESAPPADAGPATDGAPLQLERSIQFDRVSFRYRAGEPVLHGVDLTLRKGEVVALVGPSGAGKSTLADLLPRFYDPTDGAVRLDGTDLRELPRAALRRLFGIVTQESVLFHDTVHENIAFGQPGGASREDVERAARVANAHDFIAALPQGYDTVIGDRGHTLSGGQRQRLTIARAVLRDPQVLILDEATSNLDTESERLVQEALQQLMRGRTALVIAHRLSTVQHADRIVVLQDGRVVEEGRHEELMAGAGAYRKLVELQAF
jgi:ABC-type multidrug transport system fused ATPase/permease subunit